MENKTNSTAKGVEKWLSKGPRISTIFILPLDPEAVVSLEDCVKSSFYKQIELPVAKIIPLLNRQLDEIFRADSNGMLDVLFSQPHLRDFSSNIYEAFSNKYD